MLVKVIKEFCRGGNPQAIESVISIPAVMLPTLSEFVCLPDDYDETKLPAYCATGNAWCSAKLGLSKCSNCISS